jgi:hypothetical protein
MVRWSVSTLKKGKRAHFLIGILIGPLSQNCFGYPPIEEG